jgi:VCBS repeat-containing protein
MFPAGLIHFKAILAVVTAAFGTVGGVSMLNSYNNNDAGNGRFILSTNPAVLSIGQGRSANTTVTVTSLNGYTGTVALSVFNGGLFTSSFTPVRVSVPANGSTKSMLTISAPSTTQVGDYTIAVVGMSQRRSANAVTILILHVSSDRDFTITVDPLMVTNTPGNTNAVTVTVTSLNGYNGTIALQATVPFGYITLTGGQNTLVLLPGQTVTSTFTIMTSSQTAFGTYSIMVTGSSGGVSHSATVTLVVSDPVFVEMLVFLNYVFPSNTNLTMTIKNTGNATVTLQSYSVRDATGDTWSFAWANGPVIAPGATVTVSVVIGIGCIGCTYSGIFGLFTQFVPGQSYTVTLTTKGNHQFSSVVNR